MDNGESVPPSSPSERGEPRLLPIIDADGPHNMAIDETLLEAALSGTPSLRFYTWSSPTVSLGYFQSHNARTFDPAVAALPFVRRPSGGLMLVHDRELTYALALPPGPPWQRDEPWLRRMHRVIASALREFGIFPKLHTPCPQDRSESPLCFHHPTEGDLLLEASESSQLPRSAKIVGSAQRKIRGALLQHGSILLAGSRWTPSLPGVLELTNRIVDGDELAEVTVQYLQRETGWSWLEEGWEGKEQERTESLVREKFSRTSWNERR